jgi:hypothetical protein
VNFQVSLSGAPNLANAAGISLWARQAGCVGSGDSIMVPSGAAPDQGNPPSRDTYLQTTLSQAEAAFQVDIALDPSTSDFLFAVGGDFALSYGYANARQALGLKTTVEQGELEWAPQFGLPVSVGGRNSDFSASKAQQAISSQVTSDPRFTLGSAQVQLMGSTVTVDIVAGGRSGSGLIPVSYSVGLAPS